MSIDSKHPDYLEVADDYRTTRDTFGGQRVIKEANFLYLSATMGQIKDGAARSTTSAGYVSYTNYLARAVFPEFVREAVNALVGVMHAEPPIIELPEALEPMRKNATRKGESLDMLLRRINEQQLLFGRYGLLADFPQNSFLAEQAEAPHLVGALRSLRHDRSSYVFSNEQGEPLTRQAVYRAMKRVLEAVGVPSEASKWFRRSAAMACGFGRAARSSCWQLPESSRSRSWRKR